MNHKKISQYCYEFGFHSWEDLLQNILEMNNSKTDMATFKNQMWVKSKLIFSGRANQLGALGA